MQIRSISSCNLDENKINFHYNKDALTSITTGGDAGIARSRLSQFKKYRGKYYPPQHGDSPSRTIKAYKFIIKKNRLSQPTIITDAVGDLHYLFPDTGKNRIYHFCITEPSIEQLLQEKQGVWKELQKRYNCDQHKTHPTVFNRILAIHENLKQRLTTRAKRKNGLELDFAHALYIPIRDVIDGKVELAYDELIRKIEEMLAFHDEYIPPDEETLERSMQQLEDRKIANELAAGITQLKETQQELWLQIEAMSKSGENTENPDKFHDLVSQFDAVSSDLEQIMHERAGTKNSECESDDNQEKLEAYPEAAPTLKKYKLTELYIRLDEVNDRLEFIEKAADATKDKENFERLMQEREALKQQIADEKQHILQEADKEERQRIAREEEEKEKQRQAAEEKQKEEIQIQQEQLANPMTEQTEKVVKTAIQNHFGTQNNFFKPKKTFWEKFCDFFRSLFCCLRPQVDDDEEYSPRMRR